LCIQRLIWIHERLRDYAKGKHDREYYQEKVAHLYDHLFDHQNFGTNIFEKRIEMKHLVEPDAQVKAENHAFKKIINLKIHGCSKWFGVKNFTWQP